MKSLKLASISVYYRPVFPGGAGGARASPDFGISVNPISTRGAYYPHPVLCAPPPPRFSDLATALLRILIKKLCLFS